MVSKLFFAVLPSLALAHSYVACVDWDGSSDDCSEDSRPYHPVYAESESQKYIYQYFYETQLCNSLAPEATNWSNGASTVAPKVKPGETKKLVWACNGHCQADETPDGVSTSALLWHSSATNPDGAILTTDPLVEYNWNNCFKKEGWEFSDVGDIYCTGDLTIPENYQTGFHTFIWAWTLFGSSEWDEFLYPEPDMGIRFATCFQYEVVDGDDGDVPPSDDNPVESGSFSHKWYEYKDAPKALLNSGAKGIDPVGASGNTTSPTSAVETEDQDESDDDGSCEADSSTSPAAATSRTQDTVKDDDVSPQESSLLKEDQDQMSELYLDDSQALVTARPWLMMFCLGTLVHGTMQLVS